MNNTIVDLMKAHLDLLQAAAQAKPTKCLATFDVDALHTAVDDIARILGAIRRLVDMAENRLVSIADLDWASEVEEV